MSIARILTSILITIFMTNTGDPMLLGAELHEHTIEAWSLYVQFTEIRLKQEIGSPRGFLALDFLPEEERSQATRALESGEILVAPVKTEVSPGKDLDVPDGRIHHWRGAVLIPHVTLEQLLSVIQDPQGKEAYYQDVVESEVLETTGEQTRLRLLLLRTKMITVAYDTEHLVQFHDHGAGKVSSTSVATRIAEIANLGTPSEVVKEPGKDHGFLWRLNAYWRYREVPRGVIAECESVTLSRDVPFLLTPVIGPLVSRTARQSMTETLRSLRNQVLTETAKPMASPQKPAQSAQAWEKASLRR